MNSLDHTKSISKDQLIDKSLRQIEQKVATDSKIENMQSIKKIAPVTSFAVTAYFDKFKSKKKKQASYNKMILKTMPSHKPKVKFLCKLCNNLHEDVTDCTLYVAPEAQKSGLNEKKNKKNKTKVKNIEQQQDKEIAKKAQKIKKKQQGPKKKQQDEKKKEAKKKQQKQQQSSKKSQQQPNKKQQQKPNKKSTTKAKATKAKATKAKATKAKATKAKATKAK